MDDYAFESAAAPLSDGAWCVAHVRDFSYGPHIITEQKWLQKIVEPDDVVSATYYAASLPLGKFRELSGHTYIAFRFTSGEELVFSIEGRRRTGQKFHSFHGLFGAYQLIYLWGTLKDFTIRNTIHEDVYLERYTFTLSKEYLAKLCIAALQATARAAGKNLPYNTVTAQCTNKLLEIFNEAKSGTLPWHPYWHFPGLSPRLLAKHGLLELASKEIIS